MRRIAVVAFLAALAPAGAAAQLPGMLAPLAQGQFVSVPDSPSLVPPNAFTIEAWAFYTASVTSQAAPTIVRKVAGTPTSYILRLENGGSTAVFYVNKSGTLSILSVPVPNVSNAWHHLAGTWDGIVQRLYLDGVQIGQLQAAGTLTYVAGALKIGEGAGDGIEQFSGAIDEVRLWSLARTGAQISADRFKELGPTPGLVSAWRFNGNLMDAVGVNHGFATGGITTAPSTSPVVGNFVLAPAFAPIGSPLTWDAYCSEAGSLYVFDISITGTSPGVTLGAPFSATIPLNPPWLNYDYGASLPGFFQAFLGTVPANHVFHPVLNLPPFPALVGLPISATFLSLSSAPPSAINAVGTPSTTMIGSYAPSIQTVMPATSRVSGGIAVTLTGANFQTGATVKLDGVSATNVVVNGPGTITLLTPPGQLGPADVKVTNPDGVFTTLVGGLTYVPDLVVTSVTPEPPTLGGAAQLHGAGFATGLSVTINAAPAQVLQVTPSLVQFVAPAAMPCNATVAVTNPDLQTGTVPWNFSPTINQLFPTTGSHLGGSTFFVFGTFTPGTTVTVGGSSATLLSSSSTVLLVQAPPGTPGPAAVVVSSSTGCTALGFYTYL